MKFEMIINLKFPKILLFTNFILTRLFKKINFLSFSFWPALIQPIFLSLLIYVLCLSIDSSGLSGVVDSVVEGHTYDHTCQLQDSRTSGSIYYQTHLGSHTRRLIQGLSFH